MRPADEVMLSHPCTRCGAPPFVWCHTGTGRGATFLHASRFYQAQAAGELPLGPPPRHAKEPPPRRAFEDVELPYP